MTNLRVGIAGCGLIAGGPVRNGRAILGNHAAACRDVPGVRLVAAADPDEGRRTAFAHHWGVPQVYAETEVMLATEKLDIVVVATPPAFHESVCLSAIQAGVRGILCEKPFTASTTVAQRIVEACREKNCRLVVNFSRRWDASHRDLANRIAIGELGNVQTIFASYTGTLRGNGSHALDTIKMLVPGVWRPAWVGSLSAGSDDGPVEAVLSLGDTHAYLSPVRDAEYFVFELNILGTKARARVMFQGNDIRIDIPRSDVDFPGYRYLQEAVVLPQMTLPRTFSNALSELVQSVREKRSPEVSSTTAIDSLTLIDELLNLATLHPV